jgi:hypothetical protein
MLPIDLNPMRALVTEALQTPLCHVALLCNNRKTPNMALADALSVFSPYENQIVRLTVKQSGYGIVPATEDEQAAWLAGRNSRKAPIALRADFRSDGIEQLKKITRSHWHAIGSKAENLLLVMSAIGGQINNRVNELAFVIPFHYFRNVVGPVDADPPVLRERIERAEFGVGFREKVMNEIRRWEGQIQFGAGHSPFFCDGLILRSSTNCEDLPGFPSAGLYHSEFVPVFEWEPITRGIQKVWKSTYSEKAFLERREYGINEDDVGMAVLVMPALKECVHANVVAVTTNPFRPDLGGIYLNAQVGTTAVTDACGGAIPEQSLIIFDSAKTVTIQYIASSSLLKSGEYLITKEVAQKLKDLLAALAPKFVPMGEIRIPVIACELFILKNGEIAVVQARPIDFQERDMKRLTSGSLF